MEFKLNFNSVLLLFVIELLRDFFFSILLNRNEKFITQKKTSFDDSRMVVVMKYFPNSLFNFDSIKGSY